jgi:hypothetical protein
VGGMKVELHIEELVLRGVGKDMEHEIKAAMERELARLLGSEGMATSVSCIGSAGSVDAGAFNVRLTANGEAIDVSLAHAVGQTLRGRLGG